MRPMRLYWIAVVPVLAALLLATGACRGRALPPPGGNDPPEPLPEKIVLYEPLPEKIVAAWQEAGAEAGWLRINKYSFLEFAPGKVGKPGDLPAFRFAAWEAGRLAKLPPPPTAFGLELRNTDVTDVGLKELTGLESLRALVLAGTRVTDVGLKELAGLESLQSLDLAYTQVTDAGLKELGGLKSLQVLTLFNTEVTDAGLKELRKALPECRISDNRPWPFPSQTSGR